MAIIEGAQIRTPQWSNRAHAVIRSMEKLLVDRMHFRVSRRAFLAAWSGKRKALFLTRDYQQLRDTVRHEARGVCERCKLRTGSHMHHLVPVAFAPRQALERSNVVWACAVCHEDADDEARAQALDRVHAAKVSAKGRPA